MHCHSNLKTYKTYRPRKAIWSFVLVCLSCWWVPFNRLGSLRLDVMLHLSLPHVARVTAVDVHREVSPKGMPQPEEIRLDSSETTRAKIKWLTNQR